LADGKVPSYVPLAQLQWLNSIIGRYHQLVWSSQYT